MITYYRASEIGAWVVRGWRAGVKYIKGELGSGGLV
jgi:hypothetical protein